MRRSWRRGRWRIRQVVFGGDEGEGEKRQGFGRVGGRRETIFRGVGVEGVGCRNTEGKWENEGGGDSG